MIGLLKSDLNGCIIPSFGVNGVVCLRSTAKGLGGNLRVVNFVSAYFGTTEPDFSELKQGNGLLLEMNIKTSWKITFGGLDF